MNASYGLMKLVYAYDENLMKLDLFKSKCHIVLLYHVLLGKPNYAMAANPMFDDYNDRASLSGMQGLVLGIMMCHA